MKRHLIITAALLVLTLSATAREFAVSGISLLGHSQGGVIASMTAGGKGINAESLILLAPGAVIKEACQGGHFFGNSFDPKDPPEYIKCFHHFKLGRNYMLQTQDLDIYSDSEMHVVEGENHLIIKKRKEVIGIIHDFLSKTLKQTCTK